MTSGVPDDVRGIEWLLPWQPTAAALEVELQREVGRGHLLFERPAVAIGRRVDCDDVLFWLPAGPAVLAVVHLTWAGKRERSPQWPATQLYSSIVDWLERGMRPDHEEYSRSA